MGKGGPTNLRRRGFRALLAVTIAAAIVLSGQSAALGVRTDEPTAVDSQQGAETEPTQSGGGSQTEGSDPANEPNADAPEEAQPAPENPSSPEQPSAAPEEASDSAEDAAPAESADPELEPEPAPVTTAAPLSTPSLYAADDSCPAIARSYGFGSDATYGISQETAGTVLGYNGVPDDLKVANKHFVYYPLPGAGTTSYTSDYVKTLSFDKYTGGSSGVAIEKGGKIITWGGGEFGQLGDGTSGSGNIAQWVVSPKFTGEAGTKTFVQVSAAGGFTMALASDGDIWVWGSINSNGELGQGNTTQRPAQSTPVKVQAGNVKFKQISGGHRFALAVSTNGDVYGWGYGGYGATTLGTTGTPTKLYFPEDAKIRQVSAGWQHSGAITEGGDLYMWGQQANGRLGDGAFSGISGIKKIDVAGKKWRQVEAGNASTWAIDSNGSLYAWGSNKYYQLGIGGGTNINYGKPEAAGLSSVLDIAGDEANAVAVRTDGSVWTVGTNLDTMLLGSGDPGNIFYSWVKLSKLADAKEAAIGMRAAGVVTSIVSEFKPDVMTWGNGAQVGRPGTPTVQGKPSSMVIVGDPSLKTVVTVPSKTMTDQEAANSRIAFGDPNRAQGPAGWQLAKNIRVVTVSGTKYLRGDVPDHNAGPVGVYLNWNDGKNSWGMTGCYKYTVELELASAPNPAGILQTVDVTPRIHDPNEASYAGTAVSDLTITALTSPSPAPLNLVSGSTVSGLSLAFGASAKVKLASPTPAANNGPGRWKYPATVEARVSNGAGQKVIVSRNQKAADINFADDGVTPQPPETCDAPVKWQNSSKVQGTVLGENSGNNPNEFINVPVPDGGIKVSKVSVGIASPGTSLQDPNNKPAPEYPALQIYTSISPGEHVLYLDAAGNVWASGLNSFGQLGDGTTTNSSTPILVLGPSSEAKVKTAKKITEVSAGFRHSLALDEDGNVYQWGANLGLGLANNYDVSVKIPTLLNAGGIEFTSIGASTTFSAGLAKNGGVYVWGNNSYGVRGNATISDSVTPTPSRVVGALGSVATKQMSVGPNYILAATGTRLYTWGNYLPYENLLVPTEITELSGKNIKKISASDTNYYVLTDQGLYAWGDAHWGGSSAPHEWSTVGGWGYIDTPRMADGSAGLDIVDVVAGTHSAYLLTSDDKVYAVGSNVRADASSANGQLGIEKDAWATPWVEKLTLVPSLSGKGIMSLSASRVMTKYSNPVPGSTVVAMAKDGTIYGWGGNKVKQLGDKQPYYAPQPTILELGAQQRIDSGTVYFGDPALGAGKDKSQRVDVSAADIVVVGGKEYFKVKIPQHVVGTVEVHTSWGATSQTLIGCYQYRLTLYIAPDPDPQTAGSEITVRAYVGAGEETLTGKAVVDFTIPAVGNQVTMVPGYTLNRVGFVAGVATIKVKLSDPRPPANWNSNTEWRYPTEADAWILSSLIYSSLASDPGAEIVSNKGITPKPWVWWVPPAAAPTFPIYLWKIGESVTGNLVGMTGSKWQVYADSKTTPDTPDKAAPVAGFATEMPNPNRPAPNEVLGWFTANLPEGVYWLVETKAPQGFQMLAEPVQFAVLSNGYVQLRKGKSGYISVSDAWKPKSYVDNTIVVRDPGATRLPNAGSAPWIWITLLGLGVLGVTLVIVARRLNQATFRNSKGLTAREIEL